MQQSSDTTYRVFDWNRVGLDGKPRKLHLEEALESIDFTRSEIPEIRAPLSGRRGVVSDYFVMEQLDLKDTTAVLEGDGPLVLMGVGGHGRVEVGAGGDTSQIIRGQTRLVPAAIAGKVTLTSRGENTLLVVRIP